MDRKLCYVCYSPHHLIKGCDYHSWYLSKFPKTKPVPPKSNNNKPAWTYSDRVNHSNFSKDYRYPNQKRSFSKQPVPSVNTFQSTDKPKAAPFQSTARPLSTLGNSVKIPNHKFSA